MSELKLTVGGQEYRLNRLNTRLLTFVGEKAMHNFVMIDGEAAWPESDDEELYLFESNHEHLFNKVADFIDDNDLPMLLNLNEVPKEALNIWELINYVDVREYDSFPKDWES